MPGSFEWVRSSPGEPVPYNAVEGGRDLDGATIYIGRAFHEGDMIPAKVMPQKNAAYVAWGGEEHYKNDYEILCLSEFSWEYASNGAIPNNAFVAGRTSDGEPLYVGRVYHKGALTVGKVQPSHGCLYIPYDGQELSFRDYEILLNY